MHLKLYLLIVPFLFLANSILFSQTQTVNPAPEQKKEKVKKSLPLPEKKSEKQATKKENR